MAHIVLTTEFANRTKMQLADVPDQATIIDLLEAGSSRRYVITEGLDSWTEFKTGLGNQERQRLNMCLRTATKCVYPRSKDLRARSQLTLADMRDQVQKNPHFFAAGRRYRSGDAVSSFNRAIFSKKST
jgi:hypothetical protein